MHPSLAWDPNSATLICSEMESAENRDKLDRQVEIPHHLSNYRTLLVVLLAEEGHVRLHDVYSLVTTVAVLWECPGRRMLPSGSATDPGSIVVWKPGG